jgi:hypothetical protein
VSWLIKRGLLERVGVSKSEDMERMGESEAFPTSLISIGASLATSTNLTTLANEIRKNC